MKVVSMFNEKIRLVSENEFTKHHRYEEKEIDCYLSKSYDEETDKHFLVASIPRIPELSVMHIQFPMVFENETERDYHFDNYNPLEFIDALILQMTEQIKKAKEDADKNASETEDIDYKEQAEALGIEEKAEDLSIKNKLYKMRDIANSIGLQDLIKYINENAIGEIKMIEIGSYAGESTIMFAKNFNQVISIDPYLNDYDLNDDACRFMELTSVYNIFLSNIETYKNISHIKKTSDEAINDIPNDFVDFVYIDGLHTYEQVKKDIANYLPKIKNGGFIGGHDYHPFWKGVMNAVDENFKVDAIFSDSSWIVKIKK